MEIIYLIALIICFIIPLVTIFYLGKREGIKACRNSLAKQVLKEIEENEEKYRDHIKPK